MLKTESQLKAAGMESCARHYRDQLLRAQRIAVELARIRGTVTSDDVREEAKRRGLLLNFSKNWSGSVFKGAEWVKVNYTSSRSVSRHGGAIAVWKLRNPPTMKVIHEAAPVSEEAFNLPLSFHPKEAHLTELF